MYNLEEIADKADMIVSGYAFTRTDNGIRIINLRNPEKATVLMNDGQISETSMDDIELSIVMGYFNKNVKYMEEC